MLADSPVVYAPLDVYSSGFLDVSGNARHLNVVSGAAPSATSGAPGTLTPTAAEWGASAGFVRTTYTQGSTTTGTFDFWLWFAAAPAATLSLATMSPTSGSNGCCFYTELLTTGKVRFGIWQGAFVNIDSPSALSTSTWHHIIGSIGAAGMKLRVDKSTLATAVQTAAAAPAVTAFELHSQYNGASNVEQTGAIKMAHAAFYNAQLSDARTDAHFDAA
jgi:hypothetical protein